MTKPIQVFTEIVAEYASRNIILDITFEEWKAMGDKKHVPCPSGISEKCVGFVDMIIPSIRQKYGCKPCGNAKRLATKRTHVTPQQRSAYERVCKVYQQQGIELGISLEQFAEMGITKHVPCLSNLSPECDKFVNIPTNHIHRLVGCMPCRNYRMRQTMLERHGVEHVSQTADYKTKVQQTSMDRYGTACSLQSDEVRAKIRATNMERYGVPTPFHLQTIQTKVRETNLEKRGVEYISQTPDIRAKIRATNLKKYGVEHVSQNPDIQAKARATNLKKYGVEHVFQNPDIQAKARATNLEKYGVEYASQNPEVMTKARATMKEVYGAEHMLQIPELRAKRDATMVERFGYVHALQNPDLAEKMAKSRFNLVTVELSDGRSVDLQGYEPQALKWLLSTDASFIDPTLGRSLCVSDMIFGKANVPAIFFGKHRYYIDFAVHNSTTLIEVKSPYTLYTDWDVNIAKFKATLELDFVLLLIIWYKNRLIDYIVMKSSKELDDAIPRMQAIPRY